MYGGNQRGHTHADLEADRDVSQQKHRRNARRNRGTPDHFGMQHITGSMIGNGNPAQLFICAGILRPFAVLRRRERRIQLTDKGSQFFFARTVEDKLQRTGAARRFRSISDIRYGKTAFGYLGFAERSQAVAEIRIDRHIAVVRDLQRNTVFGIPIGIKPQKTKQERARNDKDKADRKTDEEALFDRNVIHLPFPPS